MRLLSSLSINLAIARATVIHAASYIQLQRVSLSTCSRHISFLLVSHQFASIEDLVNDGRTCEESKLV